MNWTQLIKCGFILNLLHERFSGVGAGTRGMSWGAHQDQSRVSGCSSTTRLGCPATNPPADCSAGSGSSLSLTSKPLHTKIMFYEIRTLNFLTLEPINMDSFYILNPNQVCCVVQLKTLQGDFKLIKSEYDTLLELHKSGNLQPKNQVSTSVQVMCFIGSCLVCLVKSQQVQSDSNQTSLKKSCSSNSSLSGAVIIIL